MQTAERKQFSTDSPKQLAEVLMVVQAVLGGTHGELGIPLVADGRGGTIQDALNEVQGVVVEDWIRQARVKWLEEGLRQWERFLDRPRALPIDLDPSHLPEDGMMSSETFNFFITTSYVGRERNRLLDRYLNILRVIRGIRLVRNAGGENKPDLAKIMREIVCRRTHCSRADDPHRDELACELLFKHYGLE